MLACSSGLIGNWYGMVGVLAVVDETLFDIAETPLLYAGGFGVDGGDGESRDITDCDASSFIFGLDTAEAVAVAAVIAELVVLAAVVALEVVTLVPLWPPAAARVTVLRFNGRSSSESLSVKSTVSLEGAVVEEGSLLEITLAWLMLDFGGSVVIISISSETTSTF